QAPKYSLNRLTSVLRALFCSFPLVILLYVFYGMDVRSRFEDVLFDMRTRLKPQQAATERVAVVSIGQGDIEALEGGNVTEASLATLKKVLQAVLAAQPAGVGLV